MYEQENVCTQMVYMYIPGSGGKVTAWVCTSMRFESRVHQRVSHQAGLVAEALVTARVSAAVGEEASVGQQVIRQAGPRAASVGERRIDGNLLLLFQ